MYQPPDQPYQSQGRPPTQPSQHEHPYPPMQPKKRVPVWAWIIVSIVILGIFRVIIPAYSSSSVDTSSPAPTSVAVAHPTAIQGIPTHTTAKGAISAIAPTHGTPLIGGPISDFIGTYGNYNEFSDPAHGSFNFSLYGNNKNDLTVTTLPPPNTHVLALLLDSQAQNGWNTLSEAVTACSRFMPADAVYKRTVEISDPQGNHTATERIYFSASLVTLFPPNEFTDENGNVTTAGIFGVVYHYDAGSSSPSNILDCSPQVGLEEK